MEMKDDGLDEVEWVKIEIGGDEVLCVCCGVLVTMVGEYKCIVFGGEDDEWWFLNDVWILDMIFFVWCVVKVFGGYFLEFCVEYIVMMWG